MMLFVLVALSFLFKYDRLTMVWMHYDSHTLVAEVERRLLCFRFMFDSEYRVASHFGCCGLRVGSSLFGIVWRWFDVLRAFGLV